ncbi:hypothetical protein GCM10017083_09250 [Thalassobaculum fulvum]|uniref:DUF5648 domain-containing protein n=1 Tax=Thalassobaculum fulvum TaxID=1633335 RepID=A0A918XNY4_9PROT|nr:hypothetical protein [Thalassobaculum fulvum]GHD43302.1 hypothetical protein GCM10017083_09250 [Thalassobaculum fulvum]
MSDTSTADATSLPAYVQLHRDVILNADLWTETPQILTADYAFEGISGIPGLLTVDDLHLAVQAGAGVNLDYAAADPTAPLRNLSSAGSPLGIAVGGFGGLPEFQDAMPVVFSWPVLPSTVDPTDIAITLNTGEVITPEVAALNPNYDYNERHVIVFFGDFGNRLTPGTEGARYPVSVTIVEDDTPLMAVGRDGPVSIVGLTAQSGHHYVSGPQLVGARLTEFTSAGDFSPSVLSNNMPNDGASYYGDEATYRLRLYTSGGFSPDGVSGFLPTEFERMFKLEATHADGSTVTITQDGVDYDLGVGKLRVIGLAELGEAVDDETAINPIQYQEDHDNYLDIILTGDAAAIARLTTVVMPGSSEAGYTDVYNPGGPGRTPTDGVIYTAPAAAQRFSIDVSLDDLGTTSYAAQNVADYDADDDLPVVFRLYDPGNGTHLYTASSSEAEAALRTGYVEEGVPFSNEGSAPGLIGVHRFFSASASDYVLTTDPAEIAALSQPGSDFAYEGGSFTGLAAQQPGTVAIHRFYSERSTDHLYTADYDEGTTAEGYVYEGVAWYAIDLRPAGTDVAAADQGQSGWMIV